MKRLMVLLVILCAGLCNAAIPKVVSMDIYPRGARMVFELDAATAMEFQLPGAVNLDSVRTLDSTEIEIDYFQKKYIPNPVSIPESLKDLAQKIESKKNEVESINAKVEANISKMGMLVNISKNEINVQNTSTYVKSLLDMYTDLNVESGLLKIKHDKAKTELNQMVSEYNKYLPDGISQLVEVKMGTKGKGKIQIEAFSHSAGWVPSYNMDLNSKTKTVKYEFMAQAWQKTGINYNGQISFYTQNPPAGQLNEPKLEPMIVDFYEAQNRKYEKSMVMNQISYDSLKEVPVSKPIADVFESLTNFAVKGRSKIDGNGSAVSVELGEGSYKADLEMFLTRDYSKQAFLIAILSDLKEPFLPGKVDLSVDGQSSGYAHIGNYGRGETMRLTFGQMPLVKVNKKTDVSKTSNGGILTAGSMEEGYILEVVNGSGIDADIVLKDRVPYSSNSKISVENISVSPQPNENDFGVMTWRFKLKPGANKMFDIKYKIKYPADKEIMFR